MNTTSDTRGPTFLCIGQQKAGTRWLYSNLHKQPDVWLPPVKEIRHFSKGGKDGVRRAFGFRSGIRMQIERFRNGATTFESAAAKRFSDRDAAFIPLWLRYLDEGRTHDLYRDLFSPAGGKITGEFTPMYCGLSEPRVREIHDVVPKAKIVFLVRDPISRVWSQYNHFLRRRSVTKRNEFEDVNDAIELMRKAHSPELFEEFLGLTSLKRKTDAARTQRIWQGFYGPECVHTVNFDDIVQSPGTVLRQVTTFLGGSYDPSVKLVRNNKAYDPKIKVGDAERAVIEERFADDAAAFKAIFKLG